MDGVCLFCHAQSRRQAITVMGADHVQIIGKDGCMYEHRMGDYTSDDLMKLAHLCTAIVQDREWRKDEMPHA